MSYRIKHLSAGILFCLLSLFNDKLIAQNFYTYTGPTGSTWAFVNTTADWNALFTVGAGHTHDVYTIPSNATVIIGGTANQTNTVSLNGVRKDIAVAGRLGFRTNGQNRIFLHPTAQVSISGSGVVGFFEAYSAAPANNYANWYGNQNELFLFGTNPATEPSIIGPFAINAPATLTIADAAVGGAAAPITRIWTGGPGINGSEWNVAANWIGPAGLPGVPVATDNVVVPAAPVNGVFPELSGLNVTVRDMILESGALFGIDGSSSLRVNGDLINIGQITVFSGGALVQASGSNLITQEGNNFGRFRIERDLFGQTSPWYIGSPISNLSKSGYSGCGNAQFNPGSTCAPVEVGSVNPCVMSMNQANTTTNINCSHSLWSYESAGSFVNGKGYNLYRAPGVLAFEGRNVNNGDISYGPLGYSNKGMVNLPAPFNGYGTLIGQTTRGWHMVSNPYPSPIELTAAQRTAMGFEAQVQFWDSDIKDWVTQVGTVTVAVGQSFQVRVAGGVGSSATWSVNNSHRRTATGVTFYKTDEEDGYINMTLSNGNESNTAHVYFVDGATDGFDAAFDANRLFGVGSRPYIYTVEPNGERLSYNAMAPLNAGESKSVPLATYVGKNGTYTITFDGLSVANTLVMLEDLTTGNMHQVSEGYVHIFTAKTTDNPNRFVLHFNALSASGIKNVDLSTVKVFPNPTNGRFTILLDENHEMNMVSVYDFSGRVVFSEKINQAETQKALDLSGFANGLYTVQIVGKQTISQKVVKH